MNKNNKNLYRYDNIPLSDATKKGMSLNIDDLGAFGRVLSLQDDVYDERFESLEKLIRAQAQSVNSLIILVKELCSEVKILKKEVMNIKEDVTRLDNQLRLVIKDVEILKEKDI